jgi:hypothetical protein
MNADEYGLCHQPDSEAMDRLIERLHAYTAALQAYTVALYGFEARVGPLDSPVDKAEYLHRMYRPQLARLSGAGGDRRHDPLRMCPVNCRRC